MNRGTRLSGFLVALVAGATCAAGPALFANAAVPADDGAAAAVRPSVDPLTFDGVKVGQSQDSTVLIRSVGSTPVSITSTSLYGRDAASFSLPKDSCSGRSVEPGGTCSITVRFTPTRVGTLVAHAAVISSNACTNSFTVAGGGDTEPPPAHVRAASPCNLQTHTVTTSQPGSTTTVAGPSPPPSRVVVAGISVVSPALCKSRRSVTVHLRAPRGAVFSRVTIRLNGVVIRRIKRTTKRTIAAKLVLRGLTRRRVTVEVEAVASNGQTYQRTQHFVTCVAKT